MIAVLMSHLPIETAHCNDPINDCFFLFRFHQGIQRYRVRDGHFSLMVIVLSYRVVL